MSDGNRHGEIGFPSGDGENDGRVGGAGLAGERPGWKNVVASPRGGSLSEERIGALACRLAERQRELNAIHAGAPWRFLARLWRLRLRWAPRGSWREAMLRALARGLRAVVGLGRAVAAVRPTPAAKPKPGSDDAQATYQGWIAAREPDGAQLELQRRISKGMAYRPLITVITPVFNPPPEILRETIHSVLAQSYDRWELLLVDAASERAGVSEALRELGRSDPRIRLIPLAENLGISANTNRGLERAQGEFVAFLDHDDLLAPDALFEVVRMLNADPSLDVVYSDEDKISEDGRIRSDPFFKPSWSPEYLLSTNYLMHSVIRRAAIAEIGGLDPAMDGAQDWDLALRLTERGVRAARVPKVLYHWRKVPGSVAADATAKMWAMKVQHRCLQAHLERRGLEDVRVESPTLGVLRVKWKPKGGKVSLIIPTKDNVALLEKCLDSVFRAATALSSYEVILVDTGSKDAATLDYYTRLRNQKLVRVLNWEGPFNYHRVNNLGAREADGDVLVFLNNDIEAANVEWLEELVRWAELPGIGCVGAKLLYADGTVQHAGIVTGLQGHGSHIFRGGPGVHRWGVFGTIESYRNYRAVTGACLAVRKDVFDEVGGFDEAYELCYGDIDLCLRVAAHGYHNMVTPFAEVTHHEGGTRGMHFPGNDVLRASLKMLPLVVEGDPFFNPNLSYDALVPSTAVEDEPEVRGARIMSIAASFGVHDELELALERELVGESREWAVYEALVNRPPAVAAGHAAIDSEAGSVLKVLVVLHDLSRSGAPMVCLHLARFLASRGHQVTVASPKDGRLRENFEEAGARVVVEPLFVGAPHAVRACFEEHDVVVANTIVTWRAVLAAKGCGRGVLWYIHESRFGQQFARQHPSTVRALAWADTIAFPSRETADLYREFDAANQRVIHYGFDRPAVEGVAFERDSGKLYVLHVGSVEARKGQDVLVRAASLLPETVAKGTEFILIGRVLEKDFFENVRRDANKLGNIRFLGEMPPEEVLRHFRSADVAVCSSRDDPSPVVVLEAMGLGKAIVSTRVGAIPEVIEDGISGLLVEKEDADGLAAALTRLYHDRELVTSLGQGALVSFDRELTLERFGREMETELTHLAARRRLVPAP